MRKDNSQSNTLYEFRYLILGKKHKKTKKILICYNNIQKNIFIFEAVNQQRKNLYF